MHHQVYIRPAKKEDLPALLIFEQELIEAERPFDSTLKTGVFHYYNMEEMIDSAEVKVVVAEINHELSGSGYAKIVKANSCNSFDQYALIGFMYVIPSQRGKGINQMILAELKKWAVDKGVKELRLQVYNDNTAAVKAYEKFGFEKLLVEMSMRAEL